MRIKDGHWLITTPIAHRGLHDKDACENSILAFKRAMEKGYAIEIDLRLTYDGQVVVFHDATLNRVTNGKGRVIEKTYSQLLKFELNGGGKIPLFSELLKVVGGKVPILIEVKDQPERKDLVKKTIDALKNYNGEYALQSFNPFYVRQFKKLAPNVMRGQLATKKPEGQNAIVGFMLRHFIFNIITSPDFISFNVDDLPFAPALKKNRRLITWTVSNERQIQVAKKYAQNIIFENIDPSLF